jgi:hypothetical protein
MNDRIDPKDDHRWVLVADDDPNELEVCIDCGAQRNKEGVLSERAHLTGGWQERYEDCQRSIVEARRPKGALDD